MCVEYLELALEFIHHDLSTLFIAMWPFFLVIEYAISGLFRTKKKKRENDVC